MPVPVSVSALIWHKDDIPDRLLELRGYYSTRSRSGAPSIYSSEADALTLNAAEAYPISFVDENLVKDAPCQAGYMKAFGFLDVKHDVFRVFVMGGFDTDWQEREACWSTSFDWQNDPAYAHLVPDP